MKSSIIKSKFEKLVQKAKEIENKCSEFLDFAESDRTEEVLIDGEYYHVYV